MNGRRHNFWMLVLNGSLLLMLLLTIFLYAWIHYQVVEQGYLLVDVRQQLRQVQEENKKLKTEIATLKQPERLEKLGRQKFGLQYPRAGQIVTLK
ncbi:MAG: cell division protein FtsL [Deltaproteobacteria bacterium]|nr:cell division protein FtsL [Deltaproteobacteria bacterium]